ncbi:MAG: DNA polymerase III subunit delta [Deltaproteobacteria bacterium]|nr:DNA polymerase III subunit delta [Deltaproteobacteria bacterium]
MRPGEFFSAFKEGPLFPLYYFFGEERYLITKAVHLVKKRAEQEDNGLVRLTLYPEKNTALSTALDDARTLPFLETRKIILLPDVDKRVLAEQQTVLTFLRRPAKKSIVIFTGKELAFKGDLLTAFNQNGMSMRLPHPYPGEVVEWIIHMAKDLGKTMRAPTASYLQGLIGDRLQDLSNELGKLSLYCEDREEIGRDDIEKTTSAAQVDSIFELTDHIGNRQHLKALHSLAHLMSSGEPPLRILTMIIRQFRMIMEVRSCLDQGNNPEEVRRHLNMKPYLWKKLYPQARKFSEPSAKTCFQRLWETDQTLKTQQLPAKIILERLIMDLCR